MKYVIKQIETFTSAGSQTNEDRYAIGESFAILLDGATGLGEGFCNANWFTDTLIKNFTSCAENSTNLVDNLNSAISITSSAFSQYEANSDMVPPSAAGIFLSIDDDNLSYVLLGDCTCVIYSRGQKQVLTEGGIKKFDNLAISMIKDLHQRTQMDVCDVIKLDSVTDKLRFHRSLMNEPDGYRIFEPTMPMISLSDMHQIPINIIDEIILYTDGFDLVEQDLISMKKSIDDIALQLRYMENMDYKLNKYPRFKISDDATFLRLNIVDKT